MPLQRQFFLFLGFIFSITFSFAEQMTDASSVSANDSISAYSSIDYISNNQIEITDSVINYGKLFLHRPYRYGSQGADTFDCSGYTSYVYRNFGYNLEHSSADQANQFDTVKRTNLKKGDLVFFAGSRRGKRVGHVGIVTTPRENGQFDFIHASCDHGVTISSSEEPYYNNRYIKANRVIGSSQLLAVNSSAFRGADPDPDTEGAYVPKIVPAKKVKKTIPAKFHKVKSGETLSEIADKYGLTVSALKRMNGIKKSKINPKQSLKVKEAETYMAVEPVQTGANKTPGAPKNPEVVEDNKSLAENNSAQSANAQKIKSHKVISGESLFSISKMYKVSVDELKKINDISGGGIYAGQVLKIALPTDKPVVLNNVTTLANNPKSEAKVENKSIVKSEPAVVKQEVPIKQQEVAVRTEVKSEPKTVTTPEMKPDVNPKHGSTVKILNHKVHAGESLVTIARDFKVSLDELMRINNMESAKLSVGQEIFICINTEPVVLAPIQVSALPISKRTVRAVETTETVVNPIVESKQKQQDAKPQSEVRQFTYKVKKGDNLNVIAEKFNVSIDQLKKMNDLANNKINVGQELKLAQNDTEVSKKEEVFVKSEPAKTLTHKVRKHETLNTIAKDFNMTVGELKEINNLSSTKIHYGQKLIVSQLTSEKAKILAMKTEPKKKTQKHKVKSGESYYSIAHKYDCSVNDLKEWNRKSSTKIQPGDVIIVKAGK